MTPDERQRKKASTKALPNAAPAVRVRPSSDDAHDIAFFQRHHDDDRQQASPGRDFLQSCPAKVRATFRAVLVHVAAAPPKKFAGGGYWEAMSGDMRGWFEVRVNGPHRRHYRLFCCLDYEAIGFTKPLLVVIDGRSKAFRTTLSAADYCTVRSLGVEYFARNPRSLVAPTDESPAI